MRPKHRPPTCGEGDRHSGTDDGVSGSVVRIIGSGVKGFRRSTSLPPPSRSIPTCSVKDIGACRARHARPPCAGTVRPHALSAASVADPIGWPAGCRPAYSCILFANGERLVEWALLTAWGHTAQIADATLGPEARKHWARAARAPPRRVAHYQPQVSRASTTRVNTVFQGRAGMVGIPSLSASWRSHSLCRQLARARLRCSSPSR